MKGEGWRVEGGVKPVNPGDFSRFCISASVAPRTHSLGTNIGTPEYFTMPVGEIEIARQSIVLYC